jgi:hypothetical protein
MAENHLDQAKRQFTENYSDLEKEWDDSQPRIGILRAQAWVSEKPRVYGQDRSDGFSYFGRLRSIMGNPSPPKSSDRHSRPAANPGGGRGVDENFVLLDAATR